jgi:release factor glutamine methyltransferase
VTLREHIMRSVRDMERHDVPMASRAAESLMMFVLGCDRAHLYAHPERQLSGEEIQEYETACARRAQGEPLQYITGHQEFRGLDFKVTPDVLIPRPETEHLVEAAVAKASEVAKEGTAILKIVDVGTGSGCIALSLAHELHAANLIAEIHAVDISDAALRIARANAEHLDLSNKVQFHASDLLSYFASQNGTFDLVVSNPPYVGRNEADKVQREVREFEPEVAVFGGEVGMDIYKRLIPQAWNALKSGGWLLMEIGYSIETQVRALLDDWKDVQAVPDLQGIPRVVMARK